YWSNELLGFKIGDLVLKRIANRLLDEMPEKGHLAHVNNNEFVFTVQNYETKETVIEFADKIIKRINKQLAVERYELYITTSIGISFYTENGEKKLTILENAHSALNRAKRLGKNNYQYLVPKDISSHKKYMLEKDLRHAISNEEFELYYQPQV